MCVPTSFGDLIVPVAMSMPDVVWPQERFAISQNQTKKQYPHKTHTLLDCSNLISRIYPKEITRECACTMMFISALFITVKN